MKKLLSLLGSLTMIGTAGATVVACGNKSQPSNGEPNFSGLQTKIAEASKLVEIDRNNNPELVQALKKVISVANEVLANKESSQEAINQAIADLDAAIAKYNAEAKTSFVELNATISEAKKAIDQNENPNHDAENRLNEAIKVAEQVAANETASQLQINEATDKLKEAIEKFQQETASDYSKLEEKIKEAKDTLNKAEKAVESVKAKLQKVINDTEDALKEKNHNQETINFFVTELQNAIDEFKSNVDLKEDPKDKAEKWENIDYKLGRADLDNNLWMTVDQFNSFRAGKIDDKQLALILWTGLFDARHGKSSDETKNSENDFKTRELERRIVLNGDKTDVLSYKEIKQQANDYIERVKRAIGEEIKGYESVNDKIKEFDKQKDNENIDILILVKNVVKAIKSLEPKSDKHSLPTDFKLSLSSNNAKKLSIEFKTNTVVYFTENDKITPVGIYASEANLLKLNIHLTF